MLLAIAALFLQIPAIPQNLDLLATVNATEVVEVRAVASETPSVNAMSEADAKAAVAEPATEAPIPQFEEPQPRVVTLAEPGSPAAGFTAGSISVKALREEYRPQERRRKEEWMALGVIEHGAATFDAWSTRQVVSSGQGVELNPLLRPFAGNNSLYAAVQVGPAVLDYVSRRMMTSQHSWMRRAWWVPQAVSTVTSIASGAHNLGVHSTP